MKPNPTSNSPEGVACVPASFHYFQSDVVPQIGDRVATGKFGDCTVTDIVDWELECKNVWSGETGHFFADDCDLLDRPTPSPAEPVKVLGREAVNQSLADEVYRLTAELVVSKEAHAAHLAKIQALTEALEGCDLAFACWQVGQIPGRPEDILGLISKVRAALALPSPLEAPSES